MLQLSLQTRLQYDVWRDPEVGEGQVLLTVHDAQPQHRNQEALLGLGTIGRCIARNVATAVLRMFFEHLTKR